MVRVSRLGGRVGSSSGSSVGCRRYVKKVPRRLALLLALGLYLVVMRMFYSSRLNGSETALGFYLTAEVPSEGSNNHYLEEPKNVGQSIDQRPNHKATQTPAIKETTGTKNITHFEAHSLDAAESFHEAALQTIRNLINSSTVISWGFKKRPAIEEEELGIQALLSQHSLYVEIMYAKSNEERLNIWNDKNVSTSTAETNETFYLWDLSICQAARDFRRAGSVKPHVLFATCNENFGAFSRYVPNRTHDWSKWSDWRNQGCTDEELFDYVNHVNTLAVFTTQHHFLDHPKVHSLPLGIKSVNNRKFLKFLHKPKHTSSKKTEWLMINDSGWKHRKDITDTVANNFATATGIKTSTGDLIPSLLENTYQRGKYGWYLKQLRLHRFILSPSGMGWDCYRIWEALHLNTIPIIERYGRPNDGWRRTLEGLPVVWVDDFREVTPELLEHEYWKIVDKARKGMYLYEKLSITWWVDFIKSKVTERQTTSVATASQFS